MRTRLSILAKVGGQVHVARVEIAKGTGSPAKMIHQLRIYEIFDYNKAAFHDRFRDHASRIMKSYGFDIVSTWESRSDNHTEFVYLLAWPDEETMLDAWRKFRGDEEWKQIKQATNAKHGDLVGVIEERVLTPTSYSPTGFSANQSTKKPTRTVERR